MRPRHNVFITPNTVWVFCVRDGEMMQFKPTSSTLLYIHRVQNKSNVVYCEFRRL